MFTIPKGSQITVQQIKDAIAYNEDLRKTYEYLDRYYLGEHDILKRKKKGTKINSKLVTNLCKYISDINVGYLLGNPVEYQVRLTDAKGEPVFDITTVLDQYKKQSIADEDHIVEQGCSIFGNQYEYTYAYGNDVHSKKLDNRNCILIYDDTMEHEKLYGIIYDIEMKSDKTIKYLDVMIIDKEKIVQYATKEGTLVAGEEKQHFFGEVPIVEFVNNDDKLGDFEQIIPLQDGYNLLQSDRLNDKEQLVDAILTIYGADLTPDQVTSLKDSRVLADLPKDSKVEYLVKMLNENEVDVLRQVLEQDIHKISMTPNLSDENFVGNSSGVAIRYKLLAFEQSIKNKERYFEKALLERFRLYNNYFVKMKKMQEVPIYEIDVIFKRNLPQNDFETSQMILNLDGKVDSETLLGQLSFIRNAKESIEAVEKENKNNLNLESMNFAEEEPNPVEEE